jgi:uncharacterized membrane protein
VALAVLCVSASLSSFQILRMYDFNADRAGPDLFLPRQTVDAIAWLEKNSARADVVLAAPEIGHFIPRLSGNTVVVGEDLLTRRYQKKDVRAKRFFSGADDADRISFLKTWRVRYVLWGDAERRLGDWHPETLSILEPVFLSGQTSVFRVKEGA